MPEASEEGNEIWKCSCGTIRTRPNNTGWTNLWDHIKRAHAGQWEQQLKKQQGTLDAFCVLNETQEVRSVTTLT